MDTNSAAKGPSLNQLFGYGFGAVYLLVGLVGFAATHGKDLIFFGLNPLHNLVHIAVGILLLDGGAAGNLTVGSSTWWLRSSASSSSVPSSTCWRSALPTTSSISSPPSPPWPSASSPATGR